MTGFVSNLRDGRVEAVFEGEPNAVRAAVDWCRRGPPGATVDSIEVDFEEPVGEAGFRCPVSRTRRERTDRERGRAARHQGPPGHPGPGKPRGESPFGRHGSDDKMTPVECAIQVEELVKHFGHVHAVDGVSFDVAPGTVFGLLGPNGSGKTTIVRILSTILHPDAGTARVLGRDVVHQADEVPLPDRSRRPVRRGSTPTSPGAENLRLTGRLAQLPGRARCGPAPMNCSTGSSCQDACQPPRPGTYSGGMRRRLDVAAALVQRPPIVFLDEPTTGLDLHSRNELWDMIRELVGSGEPPFCSRPSTWKRPIDWPIGSPS